MTGLLPWAGVWRQSRQDAAALAVTMVVVGVAAFLSSVVPQAMGAVATSALQAAVADPPQPVEVVVSVPLGSDSSPDVGAATSAETVRQLIDAGLPPRLHGVLADPVTALVGPELKAGVIAGRAGKVRFIYLASPAGPAVTWVDGRAPVATGDPAELVHPQEKRPPVEVAISETGARLLAVKAGGRIHVDDPDTGELEVWLSGIYRPVNPSDGAWAVAPTLLQPQLVDGSAAFASVGLLLSPASLPFAQAAVVPSVMNRTYTYQVVPDRLDVDSAAEVATEARGLASGRQVFDISGARPVVSTGLDRVIDDTLARVATASAQASVLLLGVLAVALLVEFLAAGLVVERRSAVIAQWRSRGASLPAIGVAQAAEAAVLTALAGAAGLAASFVVAGGLAPVGWILPPLLAALVPSPLLAIRAASRGGKAAAPAGGRMPLTTSQLRRLAAEGALVLLAAAALATLVIRGATASAGSVASDAVVLAAPVLVALAVSLGLVRVQPRLAAMARKAAARWTGAVPLVAAARTRGSGPAMAALVVAAAIAAIASSAAATVDAGRTAAAWDVVGADAAVSTTASGGLPPEVAAMDGRDGLTVATAEMFPGAQVIGQGIDRSVNVLAVDAGALARLLAATPAPDAPVLSQLAEEQTDPLPVLVAGLPGWDAATLRLGQETVATRSVGGAPALPRQLAPGQGGTVVVERTALARVLGHDVPASLGWVAGPDAGTRLRQVLGATDARVLTRDDWLAGQAAAPLPRALDSLFTGAWAVAAGLAVLAVVLMAASGAWERTRASAQLRVVGTPRAAASRVAWLESAVPAVLAGVVGLAVGAGLAALLVGALDLRSVTGGRDAPPLVVAWWIVVLPLALGLVARVSVLVAGLRHHNEPLGSLMRAA